MSHRIMSSLLGSSLIGLLLAGCGTTPTQAVAAKPCRQAACAQSQRTQPLAPAVPARLDGQPGAPGAAHDVAAVLAGVRQAQATQKGFSATAETFEKSATGTGRTTLQIDFKKPSTLRINVLKGSAASQGAKLLWTGGSEAEIKPSFMPFAVQKPINDSALVSWNGWTLKDTSPQGILDSLLAPGAQQKFHSEQQLNGKTLIMLEVVSPKRPKGATHERIGIDTATMIPALREVYKDQSLIYSMTIKTLKPGLPAASAFEL